MIYVGYPGIGKSTLAEKDFKYIDLESCNAYVDGEKPENWEKLYINFALSLSEQGYDVFVSSHKVVREELERRGEKFYAIVPAIELKDKWIEKLKQRYYNSRVTKDFRALWNADKCYEENVKDIIKNCENCIVITDIDYDLKTLIMNEKKKAKNKWCKKNIYLGSDVVAEIEKQMIKKKLKMQDIADKMFLSVTYVSNMLKGKQPITGHIEKFQNILGIDFSKKIESKVG